MAKLEFRFGSMNTGKSTGLIQVWHNYTELKRSCLILKPSVDTRDGENVSKVTSRIGLEAPAVLFSVDSVLMDVVSRLIRDVRPHCILIDEAQFMTEQQVRDIAGIVDIFKIPVIAFGLRTDFQGKLFPGSAAMLSIADKLTETKTICGDPTFCGRKATHVLRLDKHGDAVKDGPQVEVGGNDRYVAVCRYHHGKSMGYY